MNKKVRKYTDFTDDETRIKLEVYESYLKKYLPKIMMTFDKIFIADLFCGRGTDNNGNKGSAILLIDTIQYLLTSSLINKRSFKIDIFFNDKEKNNISNLKQIINELTIDRRITIEYGNGDFDKIYTETLNKAKKYDAKFFFLDPFGLSITVEKLQQIMKLGHTEILLFIPISHLYRFSMVLKNIRKDNDEKYIESLIDSNDKKGIYKFADELRVGFMEELGLRYVKPVLIGEGNRINVLFLFTENQKGMLCMNKTFSEFEGNGISIDPREKLRLFSAEDLNYEEFKDTLIKEIRERGIQGITNHEIIDSTIIEGYRPIRAKKVLKESKSSITVVDSNTQEIISNTNNWGIAEDPKNTTIFKYNNENN